MRVIFALFASRRYKRSEEGHLFGLFSCVWAVAHDIELSGFLRRTDKRPWRHDVITALHPLSIVEKRKDQWRLRAATGSTRLFSVVMNKSLKLRKQKSLNRARVKRLLAEGRLRVEQVSLAANCPSLRKSRLILPKLDFLVPETD